MGQRIQVIRKDATEDHGALRSAKNSDETLKLILGAADCPVRLSDHVIGAMAPVQTENDYA